MLMVIWSVMQCSPQLSLITHEIFSSNHLASHQQYFMDQSESVTFASSWSDAIIFSLEHASSLSQFFFITSHLFMLFQFVFFIHNYRCLQTSCFSSELPLSKNFHFNWQIYYLDIILTSGYKSKQHLYFLSCIELECRKLFSVPVCQDRRRPRGSYNYYLHHHSSVCWVCPWCDCSA